jgi:hypothetical protein
MKQLNYSYHISLRRNYSFHFLTTDGTWAHADCYNPGRGVLFNESEAYLKYNYTEKDTMNSVEAYWK